MGTLTDSEYREWVEESTKEEQIILSDEDIILSDEDVIRDLEKELKKAKKLLLKKYAETKRLNKRNEELVMIIRGKKRK